jgi:hypothetical protein
VLLYWLMRDTLRELVIPPKVLLRHFKGLLLFPRPVFFISQKNWVAFTVNRLEYITWTWEVKEKSGNLSLSVGGKKILFHKLDSGIQVSILVQRKDLIHE